MALNYIISAIIRACCSIIKDIYPMRAIEGSMEIKVDGEIGSTGGGRVEVKHDGMSVVRWISDLNRWILERSSESRSPRGSTGTIGSTALEWVEDKRTWDLLCEISMTNRTGNPLHSLVKKSSPKDCHKTMNQTSIKKTYPSTSHTKDT